MKLTISKSLLCTIVTVTFLFSCKEKKSQKTSYLNFPTPLTVETPWDVDRKLQTELTTKGEFTQVQRLFEILSWQWFISLNWPLDAKGNPQANISDNGDPEWFEWKESYEVFRPNGQAPSPWGTFNPPNHFTIPKNYNNEKILFRANKFVDFKNQDIEDEIDQAFTGPIWDQNGNITRYEVRMNEIEFDYIVKNELYNYDGQIQFSKNVGNVTFPEGARKQEGVFEIKVAWKILEESDIESRYFTTEGYVISSIEGNYEKKKVGMVGMHISSKTESSPQWIWTTFEHVDNLEVNELEVVDGKPLKASYHNSNSIEPVNVFPDTTRLKAEGKPFRTQIQRIDPISGATKELNLNVQALLKNANSKLQYYQQIGTQWPTDPSAKPYTYGNTGGAVKDTIYTLPEAVTNKSGGKPTPVYLTNMIMETYFQGGTIVGNNEQVVQTYLQRKDKNSPYKVVYQDTLGNTTTNATSGFDVYMTNEPAYFQMNSNPVGYDTSNSHQLIYGTESCIGCHFSSNIATDYTLNADGTKSPVFNSRPSSADFSWLLNQKPSFLPTSTENK
ncbi:hypothetical protein FHR24_002848 [Wenyingzhuangia heitensis]|uniref:Cytochrome P460 n=1 Tax=Wenyingzhuangia heitensis TaxID=1487859 RepID=A0ABX0UG27_9FLAO|nr:hypothetical protein [Wenyingzhuangia heitensis]NIJ46361.1 hypothetical protein [Wenyingzhuangia heitensis]